LLLDIRMDGDATLMQRFRDGDQDAAAQLFERYVGKLVGLAQRNLSSQLGRRIDAEDVVQSAFRSFFRGTRDGRFYLEPGQDLWRLLAVITVTKLKKQVEFHTAAKRDFQQERNPDPDDSRTAGGRAIEEPSPADSLALVEQVERISVQLGRDQQRIFAMRLEGHQVEEIGAAIGISERTVRRVLDKIKSLLLKQALQDGGQETLALLQSPSTE
jgi:RNA polymerase sigma-70 factor (ECF subfamily)